ncbi:hypothetical protein FPZ24_05445 [Sphingomonas panacisoli]|uniref:Uncharacterized protein n=1 Tax=Sphingomonas panacisoli TaxID=1813879 RepID=A0A5B8LFZ5_9SPHN|nr:hypothetical protein [Sphingomonas panacisoli]QDZ06991.1 hypothetical protein FPZ24_05445 [Sphingomonas panacisoli]
MSDDIENAPRRRETAERVQKEFEELLELAQNSTATIDSFQQDFDRNRSTMLFSVLGTYAAMGVGIMAFFQADAYRRAAQFKNPNSWIDFPITFLVLGAVVSILLGIWLLYLAYNRQRSVRSLRRAMRIEKEIHSRLMLLLDEQKQRVALYSSPSPVTLATYEIRIMRMHRPEQTSQGESSIELAKGIISNIRI